MPRHTSQQKAQALVDAMNTTDKEAAKEYGVTTRTIRGWRNQLGQDDEVSAFFHEYVEQQQYAWVHRIPQALDSCINLLEKTSQAWAAEPGEMSADKYLAVAKAAHMLSKVQTTHDVIQKSFFES